MLPAGKLNRLITVFQQTDKQDVTGQPLEEWFEFTKLWAWPKTQTGMGVTRNASNVAASINAYSFRVRYRTDITDAMRVSYGGLIFDIKQVRHDIENLEWTDLVCQQGGVDG